MTHPEQLECLSTRKADIPFVLKDYEGLIDPEAAVRYGRNAATRQVVLLLVIPTDLEGVILGLRLVNDPVTTTEHLPRLLKRQSHPCSFPSDRDRRERQNLAGSPRETAYLIPSCGNRREDT